MFRIKSFTHPNFNAVIAQCFWNLLCSLCIPLQRFRVWRPCRRRLHQSVRINCYPDHVNNVQTQNRSSAAIAAARHWWSVVRPLGDVMGNNGKVLIQKPTSKKLCRGHNTTDIYKSVNVGNDRSIRSLSTEIPSLCEIRLSSCTRYFNLFLLFLVLSFSLY